RRQLAVHLDEGGLRIRAVDGDDEILARLAFGLGGRALAHQGKPIRHGEDFQLALLHPAQVGRRVESGAELVSVALIEAVEIGFHPPFLGGIVMAHVNLPASNGHSPSTDLERKRRLSQRANQSSRWRDLTSGKASGIPGSVASAAVPW